MSKINSMERKNERIVYQGEIFTVYEWDQELFDGTVTTFERAERTPTVTMFTSYQGKIVIQEQEQPHRKGLFFCVPGGRVDADEEMLVAAQRELLEEEGLVTQDWEHWFDAGMKGNFTWTNRIYFARNCEKITEPGPEAGERIIHHLYTPEEFFKIIEHPKFRHRDILDKLRAIRDDEELKKEFLVKLGIYES